MLQTSKVCSSLDSSLFAQPVLRDHTELAGWDISWAILVWVANTSNWSGKAYWNDISWKHRQTSSVLRSFYVGSQV